MTPGTLQAPDPSLPRFLLTSITVSSVGCSCRQPSHQRSRTRGRLDLVMQESDTFLFSDWEAEPRMVMALGGTEGTEDRAVTLSCLGSSDKQQPICTREGRSLASEQTYKEDRWFSGTQIMNQRTGPRTHR